MQLSYNHQKTGWKSQLCFSSWYCLLAVHSPRGGAEEGDGGNWVGGYGRSWKVRILRPVPPVGKVTPAWAAFQCREMLGSLGEPSHFILPVAAELVLSHPSILESVEIPGILPEVIGLTRDPAQFVFRQDGLRTDVLTPPWSFSWGLPWLSSG